MHLFHHGRETFNFLLASMISILCYNVAADALLWFAPYKTLSCCLAFLFFSFRFFSFPFLLLLIYLFTDGKYRSVCNVIALLHSPTFGKVEEVWS